MHMLRNRVDFHVTLQCWVHMLRNHWCAAVFKPFLLSFFIIMKAVLMNMWQNNWLLKVILSPQINGFWPESGCICSGLSNIHQPSPEELLPISICEVSLCWPSLSLLPDLLPQLLQAGSNTSATTLKTDKITGNDFNFMLLFSFISPYYVHDIIRSIATRFCDTVWEWVYLSF